VDRSNKRLIIAIDGPAGSGKSTTARRVAELLDYLYLDSGAMYRAVTLAVLKAGVWDREDEIIRIVKGCDIELRQRADGLRVFLNGEEVTTKIRTLRVTNAIAPIAANPYVRELLVPKQRAMARNGGIVAEGRDIGTVVFPDADLKIFMDASIDERARRRYDELKAKKIDVDFDDLVRTIEMRDETDKKRKFGPLKPAPDAIVLDTSHMTFDEQVEFIVKEARKRGAG
jgi:cytidylate kinase